MTKKDLFLDLAKPNKNGVSRWVSVDEFVGEFAPLKIGNGLSWGRASSSLAKKHGIEVDKPNGKILHIRINKKYKTEVYCNIDNNIRKIVKQKTCVILGTKKPEVDHKNGRKTTPSQNVNDFQPLSKAANDAKRQFCKDCKKTRCRFQATNLGYPMDFYDGGLKYDKNKGCVGCFWYDPIEFRKHLIEKK